MKTDQHPILPSFALVDAPVLVVKTEPFEVVDANPAAHRLLGLGWSPTLLSVHWTDNAQFSGIPWGKFEDVCADFLSRRCKITLHLSGLNRIFECSAVSVPQQTDYQIITLLDETQDSFHYRHGALLEVLQALPVPIEIYDSNLNARFFNKASNDLFFRRDESVVHHHDWFKFGFPDQAERDAVVEEWSRACEAAKRNLHKPQITEWTVRCADGRSRIFQFHYVWTGSFLVLMLWDATEQRHLEAKLKRLADSDPLTGLWNRRRFTQEADLIFDRDSSFIVMMVDIDCFKNINDTYGHDVGDDIIRKVADNCRENLRLKDCAARWGGEEFVVLLPDTDIQLAAHIAQDLRKNVAASTFRCGDQEIETRISVGLARRGDHDANFSSVLTRADQALYKAKAAGRDRVIPEL